MFCAFFLSVCASLLSTQKSIVHRKHTHSNKKLLVLTSKKTQLEQESEVSQGIDPICVIICMCTNS